MNLNCLKEFFMKKNVPKPEKIILDKNIYSICILYYIYIIFFLNFGEIIQLLIFFLLCEVGMIKNNLPIKKLKDLSILFCWSWRKKLIKKKDIFNLKK